MSGHSKWSKVKHQKEGTDAAKSKIFTKMASNLIIAVKDGGGPDPQSNFKLRLVIEKAKSVNMPKENIQRAIDRAAKSENNAVEEIIYEAFAANGVGLLIKCATDNRQRTVSSLKNLLDKNGGTLATSGAVSHYFAPSGMIEVELAGNNLDKIFESALEAGADDVEESPEYFIIYTKSNNVHQVSQQLVSQGLKVLAAEQSFRPIASIAVSDDNAYQKIENLTELVSEHEDVLRVFSNLESRDV